MPNGPATASSSPMTDARINSTRSSSSAGMLTSRIVLAALAMSRPRTGERVPSTDADRDLERQLVEGPPGGGRELAGASRAGHPAPPGDQADRRRRAGHVVRDGRLPARPSR